MTALRSRTDRLKPCLVLNDFNRGGAERLVKDLVVRMERSEKVDPVVVVANTNGELESEFRENDVSIRSLEVDVSPASVPGAVVSLIAHLRELDVDVVHSHLAFSHLASRIACARLSIPHVATYHNVYHKRTPLKRVTERTTRRLSDRIVCVSDGVRRSHPNGEGMRVIYNAIDVEAFDRRLSSADRLAVPDGIGSDTTIFLNVARCVWQKRQRDLVEAMGRLSGEDVHLYIVGDGPKRASLEELVVKRDLTDSVTITGYVESIEPYYALADAFVSTSSREGLPTTHIEAMAARLPVVSTDIPGVREIVRHGETGYLCPVGNPDAFANAMRRLESAEASSFGDRGFTIARSKFSIGTVTDAYLELYHEIAGGTSGP